ncbi:MAG: hypothetical protein PT957_00610 [Firmicutes bacterium]|nr:hypothetical protein [Bacillota bacterium]
MSTAFPRRAWASGNMEVTTVESSTVEKDEESQETTTTTKIEKEWHDDDTVGKETTTKETVVDEDGQLISDHGEAQGKETTTIKDEEDTKEETEQEIVLENNQATTEDGKHILSEEPEVTIELQPGQEAEKAEDMAAWFDEDSLPDGKFTEETITYTRDEKGRIVGYDSEIKETTSETKEEIQPPENAEIHADGGWKELLYELPERPELEEPERDEEGHVINGKILAEIHDEEGRLAGYTEIEIRDGKIVHYSDPLMGKLVCKETKVEDLENGLKKYTVTKTSLNRNTEKNPPLR